MKIVRKIVCILLLGLMFGSPVMACLVPDADMTAAEQECCRDMAQQCGSMNMPSSHSCCETELRPGRPMLHVERAQVAPQVTAAIVVTAPNAKAMSWFHLSPKALHPPPESPPASSSILKI